MLKLARRASLAILLIAVAGCAQENTSRTSSGAAAHGPSISAAAKGAPSRAKRERRTHVAKRRSAKEAPTGTPAPPQASAPQVFVACDPNITVRAATTTCAFAENVFYEYFQATFGYISATTVRAWSPATRHFFSVKCVGRHAIVCTAGDGGEVHFRAEAVDAYDDSQAERYASTHDTGNGLSGDVSPPNASGDVSDESDGDGDFCSTHDCIPNYDEGTGSTVQCADGTWSHSGGRPGACSWHGGVG
jgi:hypothetical protein